MGSGIGSGKCGAGSLELALVAGARFIGENSVSSLNNIIVKLIIFTQLRPHTLNEEGLLSFPSSLSHISQQMLF